MKKFLNDLNLMLNKNSLNASHTYNLTIKEEKEKYFKLKEFFGIGFILDKQNFENDLKKVRFYHYLIYPEGNKYLRIDGNTYETFGVMFDILPSHNINRHKKVLENFEGLHMGSTYVRTNLIEEIKNSLEFLSEIEKIDYNIVNRKNMPPKNAKLFNIVRNNYPSMVTITDQFIDLYKNKLLSYNDLMFMENQLSIKK